ncbi:MAG: hypothetical protein J7L15_07680 [Clostridiales bacterium]|nr:hypothetical protein [Clostridiales bacterium]
METKKYAASKVPKMETLKKNKKPLTEEERKEVMDRGAVWHHGPNGEETPAVWKAVVKGETWYVCNTHRAFQCKPTLKGAINAYDFIETTAFSREKKIVMAKNKEKDLIEELSALEHKQWWDWAKDILKTEDITEERAKRWKKNSFKPYEDLSEEQKDMDREWAEKVLKIVKKYKDAL